MATNNAVNQQQPVPSWFVYQNATLSNKGGAGGNYNIPFDSVKYLNGGVTYAAPFVTVPIAGYYYITSGILLDGVAAAHAVWNFNVTSTSLNNRYYGWKPGTVKVGSQVSGSTSQITHVTTGASNFCMVMMVEGGTATIDILGGANPYLTWFSGVLLHT